MMTEQEWLECADPKPMLEFLRGKASDRKLRLFAVACCRRIWHLLVDERSWRAVDEAERFSDKSANHGELKDAHNAACKVERFGTGFEGRAAVWATSADSMEASLMTVDAVWDIFSSADASESVAQAALLRCIFGNPFQPNAIDPSSLTPAVVQMAQAIYDDRVFDRMPALADALHDAGCDNAEILAHCRGPGPHVRGCWVVDMVLGK